MVSNVHVWGCVLERQLPVVSNVHVRVCVYVCVRKTAACG